VAATGGLVLQLFNAALLLAAAPLVAGLTRWVRARLDGRRGPSPAQPYRDLARALRRRPVLAASASPVSAGAPLVAVGALALAAGLLPPVLFPGSAPAPIGPAPAALSAAPAPVSGDLVLIAALLGLSRFALALGLLDAGTAAGGLGAARLAARPALFEPVLLLVALCAAALAGSEAAGGAAPFAARAPLLLAAAAVLLVAAAEGPRLPVAAGGSAPPHDLGDTPEAAGLEFSGWHSALWDYARALRCTVFLALLAALLPGPPAVGGAFGAALRPLFGAAELAAICVAFAAAEGGLAALHPDRLPVLGAGALVLGAVAAALLLLGGVAA
jgi:formate hydrogenlyase subunit 4